MGGNHVSWCKRPYFLWKVEGQFRHWEEIEGQGSRGWMRLKKSGEKDGHRPWPQWACSLQIKQWSCRSVKHFSVSHPNCLINSSCRTMGIFKTNIIMDKDHAGQTLFSDGKGSLARQELVEKTMPYYLKRRTATKRSNECENSTPSNSCFSQATFARFWIPLQKSIVHSYETDLWSYKSSEMSHLIAMWHWVH